MPTSNTLPFIRHLTPDDAADCLQVSRAVGWGQDLLTWKRRLEYGGGGNFGVIYDDHLVGTALGMAYDHTLAWVGMVITHPDYQRRGISTRLMEAVLDYLNSYGVACIGLDATPMGRPVYERVGFHAVYNIEVWLNTPGETPPPVANTVRPLVAADIPDVVQLDGALFGTLRPRLIHDYITDYPDCAWVSCESGRLAGFLLATTSKTAGGDLTAHIGPWYHHSCVGAEALLTTALAALKGVQIRLDMPEQNAVAKSLVARYGFQCRRVCTRMTYGNATLPASMVKQFSVASVGTG